MGLSAKETASTSEEIPRPVPADFRLPGVAAVKEVFSLDLKYNQKGEWGVVNTPASADAESIARRAFQHYQFIRPQAVFEILTDAFDNVANYGGDAGYARGTVRVLEMDNNVVFQVKNQSESELSQRLLRKPITPDDGVFSLREGERHPTESGGGNGLYDMTSWLPYVYRSDVVETDKTGSLCWFQTQGEKADSFAITFELRVPIPTKDEQAKLLEIQEEQQRLEKHWAAAEAVLELWAELDLEGRDACLLESEIATCTRVLEELANATERGEDTNLRDHLMLDALKSLGRSAGSAAPTLRQCMLIPGTTHVSQSVLLEVEDDPETSVRFFTENLPDLVEKISAAKKRDARPIAAIADYAQARSVISAELQDGLLLAYDAGLAREPVTKALSAIPLSEVNRIRVVTALQDAISSGQQDEHQIKRAARMLGGQGGLSDDEVNMLIDGLTTKAAYEISKILEDMPLGQPQVEHVKTKLEQALSTGEKAELHYLCGVIERCEGEKSVLFEEVRAMFLDERYQFYASNLLTQMHLDAAEVQSLIEDTASALRRRVTAGDADQEPEKLYYPLQFLKEHPAQAFAVRDTLVDALVAGVEEFSVSQILKDIGIDDSQRQRILAEVGRRKLNSDGSTYTLERVLKK